jgi:hypothetical protein
MGEFLFTRRKNYPIKDVRIAFDSIMRKRGKTNKMISQCITADKKASFRRLYDKSNVPKFVDTT